MLSQDETLVIQVVMDHINYCMFWKSHSIKRARAKWGQAAIDVAKKEMKQLHDRICTTPVHKKSITEKELQEVMESFLFLIKKEKKQLIKSRHVVDGSMQ